MPRFETTIEVAAPLEAAFRYVADFGNAAEWDPGIQMSRRVNNISGGVDTVYEVIALFRGKPVSFRYRVAEYEENRRIRLVGEGTKARSVDTIEFERAGEGTRITYAAVLTMKGIYRVAEPFLGGTFDELGTKALASLKAKLDAPA